MKAMVLKEYNEDLLLEELNIPKPEDMEIVIKVENCGICYTDFKIFHGELNSFIKLPHIPGHEVAGRVVEIGKGVSNIKVGDKGIVYFLIGCRNCDLCRRGKENLCYHITRIGFELPGGYEEYLKIPAYNFCSFTEDISFEKMAILSDAVATPYHALKKLANISLGQSLLIVGIGGLGIHAVQLAKLMGAIVLAADIKRESLNMAESFGADLLINPQNDDPYKKIMSYTNGRGVDVVLEGVGKKETIKWSLPSLKKGGKLIIMGYDPCNPIPINMMDIHNNEWSIAGTKVSTKQELLEVIELVEKGYIDPVISKTIPLTDINEGLKEIKNGKNIGRIVLDIC